MERLREGLVISHLGQGLAVESSGDLVLCQTRRRLDTVAVGDRVLWRWSAPGQGCIEAIQPRRSVLTRPAGRGKIRPVAANIDIVFVVVAAEPRCDLLLIDQYLAVCENRNLEAALILNKIDLEPTRSLAGELAYYQSLGYPLYRTSTVSQSGLEPLQQVLKRQTGILTGQSGVGKSSLTNALIPDRNLKTTPLSEAGKHGRHTTTAATLYHLPESGNLIDSPGVAIFGLANLNERELAHGFREFQPLLENCRFNDCRHVMDKGCAVRAAAENGSISMDRYRRFLKLREKMPLSDSQ